MSEWYKKAKLGIPTSLIVGIILGGAILFFLIKVQKQVNSVTPLSEEEIFIKSEKQRTEGLH